MITRWSDIDRMFEAMGLFRGRLDSMYDDFDRAFGGYSVSPGWSASGNFPKTNLYDKGDSLELVAELPGVAKEDMNVRIQGNYLEISGTQKSPVPEGYSVHRQERGGSTFTRSFSLPSDIDGSKVKASLSDGILVLHLPKAEAAKARQILIS